MSGSRETVEEIERNHIMCARRVAEYWRRQAVKVELAGDPTKGPQIELAPNGLPRGYQGEDAIRLRGRKGQSDASRMSRASMCSRARVRRQII